MLPGWQPSILGSFGPGRMQKVKGLPVEATLAQSSMRWGFCIFDENGSFKFAGPS